LERRLERNSTSTSSIKGLFKVGFQDLSFAFSICCMVDVWNAFLACVVFLLFLWEFLCGVLTERLPLGRNAHQVWGVDRASSTWEKCSSSVGYYEDAKRRFPRGN